MITTFENKCVFKNYVVVLRPIFDTTYKEEIQVKIYMRAIHHELVLFQQSRIFFCYVPQNDIDKDILGWNLSNKKSMLCDVLNKYEFLFNGTLGTQKTRPVYIELHPGAKPYHAKPYPVPRAHGAVSLKDVEQLCQLEVLKNVNRSKWVAPTLFQRKKTEQYDLCSILGNLIKEYVENPF